MTKQPGPTASTQLRPPRADAFDLAPDAVQEASLGATASGVGRASETGAAPEDLPRLRSVHLTPLHESASSAPQEPVQGAPAPAEQPSRRPGAVHLLRERARGVLAKIARGAARFGAAARRLPPGLARREPGADQGRGSVRAKLALMLLALNIASLGFTLAVLLTM
jgi:hypothetical protein